MMVNYRGQQFGNYRLIRPVGRGGFADVYLGEHLHLGTLAAIKVLHTQLPSYDVEHFRTEARIIAHLQHPGIVRVLDYGLAGTTPFFVMDYAPNGTLRQRYPRGTPLPLSTITSYVKQIAMALQYAHQKKVIHRDIKPENMLLSENDEILLSDFGIALIAQSSRYQGTQDVVGTIAYMAPEHIQGKPRLASDQYSLGIVVYEWLSGAHPFQGSFTEICTQHMFAPPPPLHEKMPTISPAIEQVVLTALAKEPKERFEHILAFAEALEWTCAQLQQSFKEPAIDHNISTVLETASQTLTQTKGQIPAQVFFDTPPTFTVPVETAADRANALYVETIPEYVPLHPQRKRLSRLWLWTSITVIAGLIGGILFFLMAESTPIARATPEKTLDAYCSALQSNDYQSAYNQLSPSLQSLEAEPQFAKTIADEFGHISSCTLTGVNMRGNLATAALFFEIDSGQSIGGATSLIQESGNNWKISTLPSTPTLTLRTFCNALSKGDMDVAYNQFSSDQRSQNTEALFTSLYNGASCTFTPVTESGSTATTTLTFNTATGTIKGATMLNQDSNSNNDWKISSIKFSPK